MTIRNFLDRIGLDGQSDQLRIIATSASITDDSKGKGKEFVERFFGVDSKKFKFISGNPKTNFSNYKHREQCILGDAINEVSKIHNEVDRPQDLGEVLNILKTKYQVDEPDAFLTKIISSAGRDYINPVPNFRIHNFLRQVEAIWCCSNPVCTEVENQYKFEGRRFGRLFSTPALHANVVPELLSYYIAMTVESYFWGHTVG